MGENSGPATEPERSAVSTDDFDEAVAALRAVFGDVDLQRGEHGGASLELRTARSPEMVATRWAVCGVGGGSRREVDDEQVLLTGVRLGGAMAMSSTQGEIDVARPFLYPPEIRSDLDRPEILNLAISREVLRTRARAMTGDLGPELRFTGTAPVDPRLDAVWRDTTVYASRTLEALAGQSDVAIARSSVVDHVALLLLHTFPNTALEVEERRRACVARPATLRLALQFIEDHLDKPFTLPELAEASRLSLRGLHAMFRRELDTTPMVHVRRARLAAARHELQQGDPTTRDVRSVALRWGFTNVHRFAGAYRTAFAEGPEDTLEA